MPDTIESPSEIGAKAEEVSPETDAAEAKAKADRADAAEAAYQKEQEAKAAKALVDGDATEAAYQSAVEAWFHEVGRSIGIAFPVYSDYEESE